VSASFTPEDFTSDIGRVCTELTFTRSTSAATFVQYSSADDVVVLNFRFNPSEGTDMYVVWNESLNSNRYSLSPVAPFSQAPVSSSSARARSR